jgi:HSP20 family protein
MDRMFGDFFRDDQTRLMRHDGMSEIMSPQIDVSETENEVHVSAELPGIDEKDIDVTLADGVLSIRGEKKQECEQKEENFYRMERSFGQFQRSIALPVDVDEDRVDAVFSKGVLQIRLPKNPATVQARKKIVVKSGG